MKRRIPAIAVLLLLLAALPIANAGGEKTPTPPPAPAEFFGVAPQTPLTLRDLEYMRAGGIESIRVPVPWGVVQPTKKAKYNWEGLDDTMRLAAEAEMHVLPYVYGTPGWLGKPTTLPVKTGRQRKAWQGFLEALVSRYAPGGEFWREHSKSVNYEPAIANPVPIKAWQIWNEANFFYFAVPASPKLYAQLIKISSQAIKSVRPDAKVILSGLFGEPKPKPPKGLTAVKFLEALYRYPGIKNYFDGVALHPYAVDAETLEEYVEEFHEVSTENHDRPGLYITEMGWGSQNDYEQVAYEQGIQGQVRQLRDSYTYLLQNRRLLNLKQVYWYSWKDSHEYVACSFCDSVGLFKGGKSFRPKPAWHAFVALTGGRARP